MIAGIRPAPLADEEIQRGLKTPSVCTFVRAVNADPVFATDGNGIGIAKVSGALVNFESASPVADGGVLATDAGRITITRGDGEDGEDATLLFEITQEPGLSVGFMGYWTCSE